MQADGPRSRRAGLPRSRRIPGLTFALVFAVGFFWSIASPPTAAPDELDHAVYATAVARGQLFGDTPSSQQLEVLAQGRWKPSAYQSVAVPAIYDDPNVDCFAFRRDVPAACLHFEGSDRIASVVTPVSRYPPVYYAVVGLVSRPWAAGPLAFAVMRLAGVALMAALVASAVASLREGAGSRLRIVGLLIGLTPMVLFLGASVNPSGVEIVAGLALWASGVVLVRAIETEAAINGRLILRAGVAATVLTLSRQDGPLWLGLILITLAFVCGRQGLIRLWQSNGIRLWAAVVAVCSVAQLVWVQSVGTLTEEHSVFPAENLSSSAALRASLGRSSHWYHEMIGWFGWLDTPSPMLTVLLITFVLGGLVLLAVALGRTRWVVAAACVLVVTAIIPIALEYLSLQDIVAGRWQGRYALPFVVGAPLLAAVALERGDVAARISASAFPLVALLALGVAHVVAFAQSLRRYTVGYNGKVLFFLDPVWSPLLGATIVLVGFTVALGLMYAWMLFGSPREDTVRLADATPSFETRSLRTGA